jgi:aconitate hydratase
VAAKLIESHLLGGAPVPGEEIAPHVDQTLTQDATGTLIMQELEAMDVDRARLLDRAGLATRTLNFDSRVWPV